MTTLVVPSLNAAIARVAWQRHSVVTSNWTLTASLGEANQGCRPQSRYGPRRRGLEQASHDRPCGIALVDLGGCSRINYSRLVKRLNSRLGKVFRFELSTPAVTDLGTYDELHIYSDERLFGLLKERIAHTDCTFAIGVTHERLHDQSFNRHNESEGVGVVTTADANEYVPPGRSLEQYLCYLILCEAFCIVGGVHFEHDEVQYCLFDMCLVKQDLTRCLQDPCIHKGCVRNLLDGGFSAADLREANRLLKWVGSPSVFHLVPQAVQNPGSMLLLGGLVGHLLRGLFSDVTQGVFWGVAIGLAVLIVVFALAKYGLDKRRRPQ